MSEETVFKPTISSLYYLLGNLRTQWEAIGRKLGIPSSELEAIKTNLKMCDRRMIQMFEVWCQRGQNCSWPALVKALEDLDEEELAKKIDHYTKEVERIKSVLLSEVCKELVPMKRCCYDDLWLQQSYCDLDRPLDTLITETDEVGIAKCLLEAGINLNWYQIGIGLCMRKISLDDIDRQNQDLESKISSMIRTLVKSTCKWGMLISTLRDMDLTTAANSVESLAQKTIENFEKIPVRFNCTEYRRKDFHSGKEMTTDKRYYKHFNTIRDILQLPSDVSNDQILGKVIDHFNRVSPTQATVIRGEATSTPRVGTHLRVYSNVQKVGETCIYHSEEINERTTELMEELNRVRIVRNQLRKQKIQLDLNKQKLANEKKQIEKAIEVIINSTDDSNKKKQLLELEEKRQDVEHQLKEVYEILEICIEKLKRANADYDFICRELSECQTTLHGCKKTLKSCEEYTKSVLNRHSQTPVELGRFAPGFIMGGLLGATVYIGVYKLIELMLPSFHDYLHFIMGVTPEHLLLVCLAFGALLCFLYDHSGVQGDEPPEYYAILRDLHKLFKNYIRAIKEIDRKINSIQESLVWVQDPHLTDD